MPKDTQREYIAPYEPLPAGSPLTNRYLVQFEDGHTILQHFNAIGGPLPGVALQHAEYHADLADEERERVRRDAGVRSVNQETKAMEWESVRRNRSIITYPHSRLEEAPGHVVRFVDDQVLSRDRLLRQHRLRIGGSRPSGPPIPAVGYRTDEALAEATVQAIFSDPDVHSISKQMRGRFTGYIAPYQPLPSDNTTSDHIVYFHEGHTIDKHFEFMGGSFPGVSYQHLMYVCAFEDEELERVRRDPGVKLVEQADRAMRKQAQQDNRSVMTFPGSGFPDSPGYRVHFTPDTYTLAEHLARTGLSLAASVFNATYTAELTEAQMAIVLRDPNVHHVAKSQSAVFN